MRTDFLDYPTAWAIQNEVGPTLDHDPKCSSVPGHHPMAGPAFLCDCGAVEREWERRVLLIDGSPTTSQVASHGGDSPQRGIGGQGRAGTSPASHLKGDVDG